MPPNLEKRIDALFRARLEQLPVWHDAMDDKDRDRLSLPETLDLVVGAIGVLREITLQLAREIDNLAARQEPEG